MSRLDAHEEAVRAAYLQGRKDMREEAAVCAENNNFWPQEGADIASAIRELKE